MSTNSLPENDLPDIQTKNPNPPDPDATTSHAREQVAPPSVESTTHSADPSNDANPAAPQDSRLGSQDSKRGRPARHGLRRRRLFIAPEDADRFERFHRHMMRELWPADHTEHFIVEAIIAKRWLILHCDEAEAAAMRNAFAASEIHTAALMDSNAKDAPRDDDERFDHAMAATCTDEKVHLVLRYRTFHERALVRFETMLRQYRTIREAREIAELREVNESQPAHDRAHAAPRANVINHWGRGIEFINPTQKGHRVASETIPSRDDSPEVAILKTDSPIPPRKPNITDALTDVSRRNPYPTNPSPDNDLADHQTNYRNSPDAAGEQESVADGISETSDVKSQINPAPALRAENEEKAPSPVTEPTGNHRPHSGRLNQSESQRCDATSSTAVPCSPFPVPSVPDLPHEAPPSDDQTTLALRAKILADIQDYYAHIKRRMPEPDPVSTNESPVPIDEASDIHPRE